MRGFYPCALSPKQSFAVLVLPQATQLFDACVAHALHLVGDANCLVKPMELSALIWALCRATHEAPTLLDAAARRTEEWLLADHSSIFEVDAKFGPTSEVSRPHKRQHISDASESVSGPFGCAPFEDGDVLLAEYDEEEQDDERVGGDDVGAIRKPPPRLSVQELTNLLYSFGRAAHSVPSLFEALAKPVSEAWQAGLPTLCGWGVQDLANTLWACAAADERHDHLVAACEAGLCLRGYELDQTHLTQLCQFLIWWESEAGRRAPLVTPMLRDQARRAMKAGDTSAGHTVSGLQRSVGRALERIGVRFSEEQYSAEGYSLDIVVESAHLAIEVDGPTHFTQVSTKEHSKAAPNSIDSAARHHALPILTSSQVFSDCSNASASPYDTTA